MRIALLTIAMLVVSCGNASPQPCTTCLAVQGSYLETSADNQIDCGDQTRLLFGGGQDPADLSQSGSTLTLNALGTQMSGVLHSDGSAEFGPVPAVARDVSGSGRDTPGKLYLEGWFTAGAGTSTASSFEGTYAFIADTDGCELDSRMSWRR